MPTYTFKRISTEEVWTEFMSMSDREELLKDPDIEQVIAAPSIISGVTKKPDDGFNDVLKRIKSHHHRSVVRTF